MPMVRTLKCDCCRNMVTEKDYGAGWEGCSIIHGIAAVKPGINEPLVDANMKTHLCPECTRALTQMLTAIQRQNGMPT